MCLFLHFPRLRIPHNAQMATCFKDLPDELSQSGLTADQIESLIQSTAGDTISQIGVPLQQQIDPILKAIGARGCKKAPRAVRYVQRRYGSISEAR